MALSGSVTTGTYNNRSVTLNWSATQNIASNKSTISWQLVGSGSAGGYVTVSELKFTVDGSQIYYRDHTNHTNCYNGTVLASGSFDLSHNNDGTKSFSVKVEAGIYNWAINRSGSGTFTLNTIARASSITSAGNVTLGNACSIKWTPASSSFKYDIKLSLGNWSITTGKMSPNTTNAYTYSSYTIPLSVANQLPNATTGTMTAYLYTYSGNTQIGSTQSKTFTVTVPSNVVPTLGDVTASIVNDNPVVDGWGVAVAGYTKVRLTSSASGIYGSTISGFSIGGAYSAAPTGSSLSYTGSIISSSGNKTFTVSAKDSRGRLSASKTTNAITFYDYSAPKISSFSVERSPNDAKKMVVEANWSHSSVGGRNSSAGVLYYKKPSAVTWTQYGDIPLNVSTTLEPEFDENSSYNFRVIVTDTLSNSAQEDGFVSTIDVTIDFRAGGKGIAIGKMSEADNLEVAFDANFLGNVNINDEPLADFVVEQGSNYRKWHSGRAECWGYNGGTTITLSQIETSGVYFSSYTINLPISLKYVELSGTTKYATGYCVPFGGLDVGGSLVNSLLVHFYDFYPRSGDQMKFSWVAHGYWK